MFLRTYIPRPPLNEYVDRFWLSSDLPSLRPEPILPSGALDLVINLSYDEIRVCDPSDSSRIQRYGGIAVSGPYRDFLQVEPLERATLMGVHFRPGRAVPVLGVPAHELADAHVDLDSVWGPAAAELRERLCAAVTPAKRFAVLEAELLRRLRQSRVRQGPIPVALDAFEQVDTAVKVRDLARHIGLSQRRFIEIFTAEVGMTPKLYGRVRRFQRVRQLVRTVAEPDWAAVAASCGFFDQSHLIRDFGEFSGLSPAAYRTKVSKYPRPSPLPWIG